MRVLLINYEMDLDSPVLAWQARVATALAQQCTSVHVLTEKLGRYTPAPNLTVDVMPHWPGGIPKRFGGGFIVNAQLQALLKKHPCDVCFIHMAHLWAYRLWPVLKLHHLPVLLWYAHGSVTWHLKLATAAVQRVITSTPDGFRINTPKRCIIGQAIDTELFNIPPAPTRQPELLYIGRISARKRVNEIVDSFCALRRLAPQVPWKLKLVGPCLTDEDKTYQSTLLARITAEGLSDCISLPGPMTQAQTAKLYTTAALHINLSETGSMDKTVMEALASGCPVLTTNIAFKETTARIPGLYSATSEPEALAKQALALYENPPLAENLRALVLGQHDLNGWISRVLGQLNSLFRYKAAS